MRLADWLIKCLKSHGVTRVYQVTGRGSLFISDALARDSEIQVVSTHHEQAAAYAACAESSLDGGLAVCVVSSGCAATNALSGVLTAWQDELPVFFISGQNFSSDTATGSARHFRTYGEQETDVVSLASPITKRAVLPKSSQECLELIPELIRLAMSPRRGPVWLDLPLDFQSALVPKTLEVFTRNRESTAITIEPRDIANVCHQLTTARKPLILIGSSCHSVENRESVREFIEKSKIPLVFDGSSPDVYGSGNELCIGSVGSQGCSRSGNLAIQNADLVVALGSSLRSGIYGELPRDFARQARILLIDEDLSECRQDRVKVNETYRYPIADFVNALYRHVTELPCDGWRRTCLRWKELFPRIENELRLGKDEAGIDLYDLAESLSILMNEDAVFVTDSGLSQVILPTNIKFRDSQRCIQPFSQGAMGFALPAAVGAAIADRKRQTIAVTGDGSIMMNLQELETIRYHSLPIKIFVISNGGYAIIRKRQTDLFRGRTIGTDSGNGVSTPSIEALAAVFGMRYKLIGSRETMEADIHEVLRSSESSLCEISGKRTQDYVHIARALNADGRMVIKPIDNQSPWIDESIYRKEVDLLETLVSSSVTK